MSLRSLLLTLVLLASMGLPFLQLLHEATHGLGQQVTRRVADDQGPVQTTANADTDCPLCHVLSTVCLDVAQDTPSVTVTVLARVHALASIPIGWMWAPGDSRQPPVRGPPVSSA